jgi:hypothetical protein
MFTIQSCSIVVSRTNPAISPLDFSTKKKYDHVLIRFLPVIDTEYTYYIKTPLIEAVKSTGLFSEIQFEEFECRFDCDELRYFIQQDNSEQFARAYQNFPNDLKGFDLVIDFIARPRLNHIKTFGGTIQSLATFGLVSAKREFSYEVEVRFHGRGMLVKKENFVETYETRMSIFPQTGGHFQVTWEKEPLVNLIKVALKRFVDSGVL